MSKNLNRVESSGKLLSKREQIVVNALCSTGGTNRELAKQLKCSHSSVAEHVHRALMKRNCFSARELIVQSWQKKSAKLEARIKELEDARCDDEENSYGKIEDVRSNEDSVRSVEQTSSDR